MRASTRATQRLPSPAFGVAGGPAFELADTLTLMGAPSFAHFAKGGNHGPQRIGLKRKAGCIRGHPLVKNGGVARLLTSREQPTKWVPRPSSWPTTSPSDKCSSTTSAAATTTAKDVFDRAGELAENNRRRGRPSGFPPVSSVKHPGVDWCSRRPLSVGRNWPDDPAGLGLPRSGHHASQ